MLTVLRETAQFSEYFVPFGSKQEKKMSKSRSENFLFGKDSKRMDCLVSSVQYLKRFLVNGGCSF